MRRICWITTALGAFFLLCGAAVLAAPIPAFSDPAGDIRYDPAYVDSKNHDYLDVTSGAYEYLSAEDRVAFRAEFTSLAGLSSPPSNYGIECLFVLQIGTVEHSAGRIEYRFSTFQHTTRVEANASFRETSTSHPAQIAEAKVEFKYDTPGLAIWSVPRTSLYQHGDVLSTHTADCTEFLMVTNGVPTSIFNEDRANSTGPRPLNITDWQPPGSQQNDSLPGNPRKPSETAGTPNNQPSPGFLVAVCAAAIALAGRQRFKKAG